MKPGWPAYFCVGVALVKLSLIITPTYASDSDLSFQMGVTEPKWQTGAKSTVDFNVNHISRILTTCKVEIASRWVFDAREDGSTRLTYTIYSNGKYVDEIRSSFNMYSDRGAENYGSIVVPLRTPRVGENTVKISTSIDSTTMGSERPQITWNS